MSFKRVLRVALLGAVVSVAVLALAGCAGKTCPSHSPAAKDVDAGKVAGHVLEYRMSKGDPISYRFTSDNLQTLEVQGQEIPVESNEVLSFSVTPKGMKDGDNALGITIDGLTVSASSPQGGFEADTENVVGKSFEMTVSKIGIEGELPETDDLSYTMPGEGDKSILTGFGVMFPDLPEGPIEIGDTWPATLEIAETSEASDVTITVNAVNTLEGFETFSGLECAKIASVLTGTIAGSGTQQGAAWTMQSDMDGSGIWYFAHKRGILVSDVTEGTSSGTIVVDGPDGQVTMPVVRDYSMVTELVQ